MWGLYSPLTYAHSGKAWAHFEEDKANGHRNPADAGRHPMGLNATVENPSQFGIRALNLRFTE